MKNIYKIGKELFISSNEEIKPNDYITDGYRVWKWKDDSSLLGRKKVVMTTDKDIIAEGVQEIEEVKMYSEEEVRKIAIDAYAMGRKNILIGGFNKWFSEIKKK